MNESMPNHLTPPVAPAYADVNHYSILAGVLNGCEEFTLDPAGRIVTSNLEAVNITGYENWEVVGKPLSIFYLPDDRRIGQPEEDLARAHREGELVSTGWRLKKKNASFWARVKITTLRDPAGTVTGFGVAIRDTTHRELFAHRLKRIRNEYHNLFNNEYTGIFKFRMRDFRILLLNDKASQILDTIHRSVSFFHEFFADPWAFETFAALVGSKGRALAFEFHLHHTGISERWAEISCRYFPDGDFVEGIIVDTTEKKTQMVELQRLNYELDQFIYHASHDLRSPLTSILGLVNLIEMDQPGRVVVQYSQMIRERVNHLDSLLKNLVSITFNNQAAVQAERIDFESELNSILHELHADDQPVRVFTEVQKGFDFYTEPIRLRTILRSVISNALKYHNEHATPPYLKVEVFLQSGKAVIVARDNGIGIDEQHLVQVFQMFFRATTRAGGSGLGLYIVKSMVDKLGGSVNVKSSKGLGTEFRIELPSRPAA